MQTQPETVIIESTFSGFQAYATALPDVVVTGKNVPEAKTKLKQALQDHLRADDQLALPADVTYHIVY
jgi:predicted RNase H-like HicB family nuclease